MCWFTGVVVITSALHIEGLGFNLRGKHVQLEASIYYIDQENVCWFPGVAVITSALHAEDLGFDPRGNLLPSFCDMYVKLIASIYYIDQEKVCGFPGVAVITSASHAEGLGIDPRGNLLPSFCHLYVTYSLHWGAGSSLLRLLYTQKVSGSIPEGSFAIFLWLYVEINSLNLLYIDQEKVCGFPGVVVITSASHAEGLGIDPRGNLLPSFCHLYIGAILQRIISGIKKKTVSWEGRENLIISSCFLRMLSIIMILLESPTHKTAKLLIVAR